MIKQESKLYTNLPVAEKYAILEAMRLELDRLYREDRPTYDRYRATLKPNTWDALEENWKLWDPVPKSRLPPRPHSLQAPWRRSQRPQHQIPLQLTPQKGSFVMIF